MLGGAALAIPGDIFFRVTGGPPPPAVDAALVFVGYGLHLPEAGHDDFAGVDLRGKIAVAIAGGPARCPARSSRMRGPSGRGSSRPAARSG